jgi:hypothetical protein
MNITVHFLAGIDQETEDHYSMKEYRDDVIVEINNEFFEVYFFTKDSLEFEMTNGGFFSFPGMIILDEIGIEKIKLSILKLEKLGFFEKFKGSQKIDQSARFSHSWYINELTHFDDNTRISVRLK